MSGPPFPPAPVSGSNAIGSFQIGVSPIGPIESFQVWKTIISQYSNSPILTQLCQNIDAYVDQTTNFSNLFDQIWNIDSAQGYGLDVWGRIVGVQRNLTISSGKYFGFEEQGTTVEPFGPGGVGPFYSGVPLTGVFRLTDTAYRQLIFAKALANICDGSIMGTNQILINLFGNSGKCYVTDGQDMTMTYTFEFLLSPLQSSIIEQSGVLPKPVGVTATVVQIY